MVVGWWSEWEWEVGEGVGERSFVGRVNEVGWVRLVFGLYNKYEGIGGFSYGRIHCDYVGAGG